MSRQRYEPVPQRDEVIILDSIHNSPNYNYNSAIPTSVASSIAPSISSSSVLSLNQQTPPYNTAPPSSIPSSPPPSFHTISSPGTPRPAHSIRTAHSNPSYAELWGVAASTVGGARTETEGGQGIGTSNDALATIAGLRTRVEWLEESIGRLLLEKDALYPNRDDGGESSHSRTDERNPGKTRNNCCVTFTATTPDLERAIANGGRNNCCVTFRAAETEQRRVNPLMVVRLAFFAVVVMFVTLGIFGRGGRSGGDNIRIGSKGDVNAAGFGGNEKDRTSGVVTSTGVDLD